jgi:hypothetical protein
LVAGYCIPTIALFLGVMLFVSGSSKYKKNPPGGSMISVVARIFYEAIFASKDKQRNDSVAQMEKEKLLENVVESGRTSEAASERMSLAAEKDARDLFILPSHWLDR